MAEEAALKPLWDRVDEHTKDLNDLKAHKKVTEWRMAQIDKNFERYLEDSRQGHAKLMTTMETHAGTVQKVLEAHHRSTGVRDVLRWAIPVVISLAGVIVAIKALTP